MRTQAGDLVLSTNKIYLTISLILFRTSSQRWEAGRLGPSVGGGGGGIVSVCSACSGRVHHTLQCGSKVKAMLATQNAILYLQWK